MVNKTMGGEAHCGPRVRKGLMGDRAFAGPGSMGRCHWANMKGEALHARKDACSQGGVGHSYWNRERLQGSVGDEVELCSVGESCGCPLKFFEFILQAKH